ncbi:MAG: hypothetical protein N2254_05700 [bacterium]|nr:hypothetical protein [bacterium]
MTKLFSPYVLFLFSLHFALKLLWSYLFFNYPTLEDTHRIFTFLHSLQTKDLYVYQLDVSYHGALLPSVLYFPFAEIFGTSIFTFRLANSFLSSITLLVSFLFFKDLEKKVVFFLLFTFSPLFFQRNLLIAGNYAFVPLLTILVIKTDGFLKGLFFALAIQNHPLSVFLIVFFAERKLGQSLLGTLIGLLPSLVFNIYNFFDYKVFPTLEDMNMRSIKFSPEILTYDPLFLPFFILSVLSVIYTKDVRRILAILILFFIDEERFLLYMWSIVILTVSENFSRKDFITVLPLFSIIYFLSNIPSTAHNTNYLMSPYGKRHYVVDEKEIKKEFVCIEDFIKSVKNERIAGDVMSTNFVKFYYPAVNIYYFLNFWSYVVPVEFRDKPKFVIFYNDHVQENECKFKTFQLNLDERRRKEYFRETGLKSIFLKILYGIINFSSGLFPAPAYADIWVDDQNLGWVNRKQYNSKVPSMLGFPSFNLEINEQGGRDNVSWSNISKKKILILGDSVCFGFGINFEHTLGEIIERKMGDDWFVMNMSVVGYSTDQQLIMLEREGIKYNPDIVIFCLWVNDIPGILDSAPLENGGRGKPVFVLEEGDLKLKNVPPRHISLFPDYYNKMFILTYGKYALNYYIKGGYKSVFEKAKGYLYLLEDSVAQRIPYRMLIYRDVVRRYIDLLKALMKRAVQICNAKCKVYLVAIPDYDQVLGRKPYVERIYDVIQADVNFLPVVRINLEKADFFPKNQHPNGDGHKKIAEQIYRVLLSK